MRIVISNPGVGSFIQQTVRAFHEAGSLDRFYTTVALMTDCGLGSVLFTKYGSEKFRKRLAEKFYNRLILDIPSVNIHTFPVSEIARVIATRLGWSEVGDTVWEWSEKRFDKLVSKNLEGLDAVYAYEHAALETFRAAKIKGIRTIYEMPAPHHATTSRILDAEYEKYPELAGFQKQLSQSKTELRNQRREQELRLADIVVCNSNVTRDSLINAGVESSRIIKVPLGMPAIPADSKRDAWGGKMICLYAGSISLKKGVHYLLKAWETFGNRKDMELQLFGHMELPEATFKNLSDNVVINKPVSSLELREHYRSSSILLFPTLFDGFGMVVSEALAEGLPVLTTTRAGASEFIKDKYNGFIVPVCDPRAIVSVLEWCASNRDTLHDMRDACTETARSWQWEDYRHSISSAVRVRLASEAVGLV